MTKTHAPKKESSTNNRPPFEKLFHMQTVKAVKIGGKAQLEVLACNKEYFPTSAFANYPVAVALTMENGGKLLPSVKKKILETFGKEALARNVDADKKGTEHFVITTGLWSDGDVHVGAAAARIAKELELTEPQSTELAETISAVSSDAKEVKDWSVKKGRPR